MVAHGVASLEWDWLLTPAFAAGPDILVYSEASGSWGFGAGCQPSHKWFQVSCLATWSSVNITGKELLPIVLAAATWGSLWSGQAVRFHCDNAAIVDTISSDKSTEPLVMQLLRGLHLFTMEHAFSLTAAHIAGMENGAADALSCNQAHLLEAAVDLYLGLGVARSTHRTYNSGQQHYLRFCQHTGLQPIPASEDQLMLFATPS